MHRRHYSVHGDPLDVRPVLEGGLEDAERALDGRFDDLGRLVGVHVERRGLLDRSGKK